MKEVSEVAAHIATVVVALSAAWWFLFSRQLSKRIEFNLEHDVFTQQNSESPRVLQLIFTLENKGQVLHYCYVLAFEVVEMQADGNAVSDAKKGYVFRSGNIVNQQARYYYVRPGVCQRIAHSVSIPPNISLVKVRAFFTYARRRASIDPTKPVRDQYLKLRDWTALVRVISLLPKEASPNTQ